MIYINSSLIGMTLSSIGCSWHTSLALLESKSEMCKCPCTMMLRIRSRNTQTEPQDMRPYNSVVRAICQAVMVCGSYHNGKIRTFINTKLLFRRVFF